MSLTIIGDHDEGTIKQIQTCLDADGTYAVLCADGHLGYSQPIGGVVAYRDKLSISGAGFDAFCGNYAVKTDILYRENFDIHSCMNDISRDISFGVGRTNKNKVDHELFDHDAWNLSQLKGLKSMAHDQLGTVGSGNHYVDIFAGNDGYIWVGVHFGSRGLGHKTVSAFLKEVGGIDGMHVPPTLIEDDSQIGFEYLLATELCGLYAYAGREYVVNHIVYNILKANILDKIHNHHNFIAKENHFGEDFWVVRKGATPAFPGQRGFVGGSMGDDAVIIKGVDSDLSKNLLYSTVHGAGRVMSRTQARGKINRKTGEVKSPGQISKESMRAWLQEKNVVLHGGDVDEAPQAYRRLNEVLEYHAGTIEIETVLTPIGVAMAGKGTYDPYKD